MTEVLRARRYELSTQMSTNSMVLPYWDYAYLCERDGYPLHDPPPLQRG